MITLIATITAFVSGAVVGHLRALKASQQSLFDAHQAGFYEGRSEQTRKIKALQHRVIHLEADARRLPVARSGVWEQ